jgi:hypothetical protein
MAVKFDRERERAIREEGADDQGVGAYGNYDGESSLEIGYSDLLRLTVFRRETKCDSDVWVEYGEACAVEDEV